jgi:oligopeptide/dipeptide ABC transporter ATP-binding protein
VLIITHDLGVVARVCDTVAVMYAGKILEIGTTASVLRRPAHPYTGALLNAVPRLEAESDELPFIEGSPPDPLNRPEGCPFEPRCRIARTQCKSEMPPAYNVDEDPDHTARCWAHNDPLWLLEVHSAYTTHP